MKSFYLYLKYKNKYFLYNHRVYEIFKPSEYFTEMDNSTF